MPGLFREYVIFILYLITLSLQSSNPWKIEDYPNPQINIKLCNLKSKQYVCDPDNVLSANKKVSDKTDQIQLIIDTLERSFNSTNDKCPGYTKHQGYRISVAILQNLDGANNKSLVNLNRNEQANLMSDRRREFAEFSDSLLKKWSFSKCNNDIIIVYLASQNSFYTSTAHRATRLLTSDLIYEVAGNMGKSISIADRIDHIVSEYTLIFNRKYIRKTKSHGKPNIQASISLAPRNAVLSTLCIILTSLLTMAIHFL